LLRQQVLQSEKAPWLEIDGELQADAALLKQLEEAKLRVAIAGKANVWYFPGLESR
jgi:phosphotransacetylase